MKRLFPTPNLRMPRHAPNLYALRPDKSLLAGSTTTLFEALFRSSQLLSAWCRVWLSELQSPRTSTPLFHTIEFA